MSALKTVTFFFFVVLPIISFSANGETNDWVQSCRGVNGKIQELQTSLHLRIKDYEDLQHILSAKSQENAELKTKVIIANEKISKLKDKIDLLESEDLTNQEECAVVLKSKIERIVNLEEQIEILKNRRDEVDVNIQVLPVITQNITENNRVGFGFDISLYCI